MLANGRIEWKNYKKTPPVYVGPDSCHDPQVKNGIVKGVGLRLRINSSKDEYFDESVENASRAFKISGYNYQKTKNDLLKFRDLDPLELIKEEKEDKKKPDKGVKAYFVSKYDPRMPHPRALISRNYHHIQNHPVLSELFPRENLVGGTKRLKNLSELLSPTVQKSPAPDPEDDNDENPGDDQTSSTDRHNGSYHCSRFREKNKCEVCSHMMETSTIYSFYFQRNFAIHGRNIHLPASQKKKFRWFIYVVVDVVCELMYVGSTTDVCARWAQTKKACLDRNNSNTGLCKHFQEGCPGFNRDLSNLQWTLVDSITTSEEELRGAGHQGGAKCRCSECNKLKNVEDKWICRLGTFYEHGLNTRDEIKARSRVNFTKKVGS